ncbi:polysaccharide deacetylase family protein [Burkholderia territorii]|uniref:polysaccharide deacetylase family protein n=1 Tax=Burkholderia territorii TaxID=1503055 RepID=UPI000754197F|nr:polysaccharide deacetylase [Burkholderia territorii]KVG57653.1 polysaccharide deacetylase [Burkholderia territorii]KVQ62983.1 polysaccharide deacetylase [Burkholderia territorii]KWA18873.1 polysaccharide deacetylase [Burkholderia territorii]KWA45074.1 polysaccharide deacetylase [Burkholderia territorii]
MTTLPAWPDGARCAVAITVDFNDIHGIQTREPRIVGREKSLSAWRYGATRGVDRLLDAFDAFGVPASWFVPGIVAETHADAVREIAAAGHELGVSGYRCEDFDVLPLAAQIDACRTGRAALADTIGRDVEGFRSFTGNWADGFADWLVAEGFTWSSSWRGDDLPYVHPRGDARADGARLVELPLHYELDDEPYFEFNLSPPVPTGQPRIAAYRDVLDNWRRDVDGFRRFGLCCVLRLHPEIIGTAGRVDLLRALLAYLRDAGDVWFATGRDIARWWRARAPVNPPGHPVDVFAHCVAHESAR